MDGMVGQAVAAGSLRADMDTMVDRVDSHMVAAADTETVAPADLDRADLDRMAAQNRVVPERRKAAMDQDKAAVDTVDTSSVQKEQISMNSYLSIHLARPRPNQSPSPEQYQRQRSQQLLQSTRP